MSSYYSHHSVLVSQLEFNAKHIGDDDLTVEFFSLFRLSEFKNKAKLLFKLLFISPSIIMYIVVKYLYPLGSPNCPQI